MERVSDMQKTLLWITIACLIAGLAFAETDSEILDKIIAKQDELYRSSTSHAFMEMSITTPNWERTLEMEAWSEGMDKSFIVINAPAKEKGTATLRVDEEMWNYLPKTDKVMKIPPSMMMSSWMGSDFTNDDLVRETSLKEDYDAETFLPEQIDDELIYIRLTPKEDTPTVWGKIEFAVRKSDYLPVWQRFYNERNELVRIIEFKEIKNVGGKTIPTVMELIPQNKVGHKTIVRYIDVQFDIPLDPNIFSLRNLQKTR